MTEISDKISRFGSRLRTDAGAINWQNHQSADLVALLEADGSLIASMNTFWPSERVHLNAATRGWLFMQTAIFKGLIDEAAGGAPYYLLPGLATIIYSIGPGVEAEVYRRGSNHIGFDAALLLLIMDVARSVHALPPSLEAGADELVNRLRRAAWRRTPSQMRDEITGQIPLVLDAKWGHADPWEVLAGALGGGLNIAPRAIRDAVVKQGRPESRRREIEFLFTPSGAAPETSESAAASWEDVLAACTAGPDVEAERREQLQRARAVLERDPRLRQAVEAILRDGATQKQVADMLGVTDRTIRNWLDYLRQQIDT